MNEAGPYAIILGFHQVMLTFCPTVFFSSDGHPENQKAVGELIKNKLPKSILALKGKDKVATMIMY